MGRGLQGPAKKFAALVHVHSFTQGAGEEKVSLSQKGNAHLKQENGTFFRALIAENHLCRKSPLQ